MFPLFELVKILNIGGTAGSQRTTKIRTVACAWKEVGDMSQLALLLSNGYLLLRYCAGGRRPITQQLPWYQGHPIKHMCFDATGTWLLCVTQDMSLFIIPVLTLMDHKARVNRLWRIDDVTHIKVNKKGCPTCVAWWYTLNDQHVAVVGMENGKLVLVNMVTENIVAETEISGHVSTIELVRDDRQSTTYALITTTNGSQWRLVLEQRNVDYQWSVDKDLQNLGYEQIDSQKLPMDSIIHHSEENQAEFLPRRFYQFSSLCHMSSQYAKGRHFVGVSDPKVHTLEIYDSNIEHSPLFVYSIPPHSCDIIFTDKLTFTSSHVGCKKILVQSNQLAETSAQGDHVHKINPQAMVQEFHLPNKSNIVKIYKRCYPFYWHEKKEEKALAKAKAERELSLSGTVLVDSGLTTTDNSEQDSGKNLKSVTIEEEDNDIPCGAVIQTLLKSFRLSAAYRDVDGNKLNVGSSYDDQTTGARDGDIRCSTKEPNSASDKDTTKGAKNSQSKDRSNDSTKTSADSPRASIGRIVKTQSIADKRSGVFAIPVATHTVLNGCIIVTEDTVYECRPRKSPERLFLELALQPSEVTLAEKLGIMLGLDINALYKMAADHTLTLGDYVHAVRLFQLSKCPHVHRVSAFAKHGRMSEVMTYIQQALGNRQGELTLSDRKQLSDMAIHCFIHQLLSKGVEDKKLLGQFREFLLTSFSYDEREALRLLAEYNFSDLMFEVARTRGFIVEAVELLVSKGRMELGAHQLKALLAKGYGHHIAKIADGAVLRCMSSTDLVEFLLSKPSLAILYIGLLKDMLNNLDESTLLQMAHLFDPSKPVMQAYLLRARRRKRSNSLSSVSSYSSCTPGGADHVQEDSNQPDVSTVIEFFLHVILQLNKVRGHVHMSLDFMQEPSADNVKEQVAHKKRSSPCSLMLKPQPVGCAQTHTGLVRKGELFMWGHCMYGKLGNGDRISEDEVNSPTRVDLFSSLSIKVLSIACGAHHTIALTNQGMYGWGCSKYGQVGVGTTNRYNRPMLLETMLDIGTPCVSICCGQYHSMALMADSSVYSWGWGAYGQLGHKCAEDEIKPREITALTDAKATKISAGYAHSMVLTAKGSLFTFGCAMFGQLGHGDSCKQNAPRELTHFDEPVHLIATKFFHSLAVTVSGKLYKWGSSPFMLRQTAHDMRRSRSRSQSDSTSGNKPPVEIQNHMRPALVDTSAISGKIIQVACGSTHSLCLTSRGSIFSWGRNAEGQLGNCQRQEQKLPGLVAIADDNKIEFIDCGLNYSVAVDVKGQVWAWGRNEKGQLGLLSSSHQIRVTQSRERDVLLDKIRPTLLSGFSAMSRDKKQSSQRDAKGRKSSNDSENWWSEDCYEPDQDLSPLPNLSILSHPSYSPMVINVIIKVCCINKV